jgi:flavorubredoxin
VRSIVIYESLTGNTRTAAEGLARGLTARGITTVACPITKIDYQALSEADLVIVGSWVDGLFVVGQRPGRVGRIAHLPALSGKRAIVFLTYALHPGKALQKLSDTVAARGAEVLGGITIRRDRLDSGVDDLVDRILDAVAPA